MLCTGGRACWLEKVAGRSQMPNVVGGGEGGRSKEAMESKENDTGHPSL